MNKIFLIGNLTRDPELRTTESGLSVCNFTVAVNRRSQSNHPEADYFRVTAWRGLGEQCAKYLKKGSKCCVVGAISARGYSGNDGTPRAAMEVTAEGIQFLTFRNAGNAQLPEGYEKVEDEELPF